MAGAPSDVAAAAPISAHQPAPILLNPFQLPAGMQLGVAAQVQVWQGQFPPPEAIERYEQVMPGAFDRIVSMAERQQVSVIDATADVRKIMSRDTQRGHWLGWSVTVGSLLGAVVCAYLNQPVVAVALVAVPVMSVAKALIDSSRAKPATIAAPQPPAPNNPSTDG